MGHVAGAWLGLDWEVTLVVVKLLKILPLIVVLNVHTYTPTFKINSCKCTRMTSSFIWPLDEQHSNNSLLFCNTKGFLIHCYLPPPHLCAFCCVAPSSWNCLSSPFCEVFSCFKALSDPHSPHNVSIYATTCFSGLRGQASWSWRNLSIFYCTYNRSDCLGAVVAHILCIASVIALSIYRWYYLNLCKPWFFKRHLQGHFWNTARIIMLFHLSLSLMSTSLYVSFYTHTLKSPHAIMQNYFFGHYLYTYTGSLQCEEFFWVSLLSNVSFPVC